MPGAVFLRGERVVLRTMEREDVDIVQRAYNEPAFQEGFLLDYPKNREMIEAQIDARAGESDDSMHLLICVDGDPVGRISVKDIRQDHGMLGYWLVPEERGHGYITEAAAVVIDHVFDTIGLHRVFAWTIDDNEASQEVLRRLGFTHEGTYREHVFIGGAYRDTEHYGLLVSEWPGAAAVLRE